MRSLTEAKWPFIVGVFLWMIVLCILVNLRAIRVFFSQCGLPIPLLIKVTAWSLGISFPAFFEDITVSEFPSLDYISDHVGVRSHDPNSTNRVTSEQCTHERRTLRKDTCSMSDSETTEAGRSSPTYSGGGRHEKSLGLLTAKFVDLLQVAEGGVLDLKKVSFLNMSYIQSMVLYMKVSCEIYRTDSLCS